MSIYTDSNDIWLETRGFEKGTFAARLGCGGALSNLIFFDNSNTTRELLSPSFRDEATDRIIQWTLWSNGLTHPVDGLPEYEWRYNVTQGGDFNGNFSDTRQVTVDQAQNRVDVFATPTLNWKREQQSYFHGGFNSLTIYQLSKTPGKIQITRILKPFNIATAENPTAELGNSYLEAWTPLSNKAFNSIALSFALGNGYNTLAEPLWWYSLENLPTYPNLNSDKTDGYFLAFDRNQKESGVAMALVYGKQPLQIYQTDGRRITEPTVVNSMTWDTGFGLLPAIKIPNWKRDGVLIMHYDLLLNCGVTKNFVTEVESTVASSLPPVYYENPNLITTPELRNLVSKLDSSAQYPPVATNHLGSLIKT